MLDAVKAEEFTVELHPLDVTRELLQTLRAGGVNRISMGVQSADDSILQAMGRGYSFAEAERAFSFVREYFDNAGIDLIVGYPGETAAVLPQYQRLRNWGLAHCSVYSLILEEKTLLWKKKDALQFPDDEQVMDRLREMSCFLGEIGLERYEISNYAVPGRECRHNLAVWRGEDYLGIGFGAHGRLGPFRIRHFTGSVPISGGPKEEREVLSDAEDRKERRIFRLRTREGLDATGYPSWLSTLDKFAVEGLLSKQGMVYRLTERGTEVCDSILAEIV